MDHCIQDSFRVGDHGAEITVSYLNWKCKRDNLVRFEVKSVENDVSFQNKGVDFVLTREFKEGMKFMFLIYSRLNHGLFQFKIDSRKSLARQVVCIKPKVG